MSAETTPTIDKFLDLEDPWNTPVETLKQLLVDSIREAAVHHYNNNKIYRTLCDNKKFDPKSIQSIEDFIRIPVISTQAFKTGLELRSVPENEIVKINKSSGSSGQPSLVPRDQLTVDRLMKSIKKTIPGVQPIHQGFLAMMSPSPEEYADLTMAYMSQIGCELADNYEFYMKDFDFDPEEIIKSLNNVKERPIWIGGGPMLILDLADWIEETGQKITTLTADSGVSSGGGFKDFTGHAISREEYNKRVISAFGVDEKNIRDSYGMTELNGFAIECEHHIKHLPPWIYVSIRNPDNFDEEVAPGEEGLPVFLDPIAHSYPGFIIADDITSLAVQPFKKCSCGRIGPALSLNVRRAEGAEDKGCGRQVDSLKEAFSK